MSEIYPPPARAYEAGPNRQVWVTVPKQRVWLHALLFALTVLTTLAVGAQLSYNYAHNRPAYDLESEANPFSGLAGDPRRLLDGIPFSATLLAILLVHELGHYVTCRAYGIAASYPYFIPAPTIIGTMGAFIRIRSPIVSRRALFDVGVSGPVVGFVLAVPVLALGIAFSKVSLPQQAAGTVTFGNPPLVVLLEALLHPGISRASLYLHPIARAAWVGLFATALNLLPAGQLDGGHILYALSRRWHRRISRLLVVVLAAPGLAAIALSLLGSWVPSFDRAADIVDNHYWHGWLLWAALLLLLGTRHPAVVDPLPLDRTRRLVAFSALVIFLLCFTPTPFLAA